MAKKASKKKRERSSLGKNILMTLTLVPVVLGLLLILAWALDLEILENQSEIQVGIFNGTLAEMLDNLNIAMKEMSEDFEPASLLPGWLHKR